MELYILSKQDLSILSICKVSEYQINLDEETNAKTTFSLLKKDGLKKDNFIVLNGLYRQFLFVIDDVQTDKSSNLATVTALDISNIFNQKVIEKNTEQMTTNSIEEFLANTISENFVNSDDTVLNIGYIDIAWHTNTQGVVATNAENGLYNFHTFMTNCRQYKNIYTEFTFDKGRLKIDIANKEESVQLIDTTLPEVTDYNKIYEEDVTAKVTVLIREDGSEYNLYLKTDRATTTDKNDPDRAKGKVEVISVDTADKAAEEALNVIRGNSYNHLVEFKIAKTSKLMDISKFTIGRPVRIKTDDDIYDSYISAITLSDENFVYFKSGKLRATFLEKIKKNTNNVGNKLDLTGGVITGNVNIKGNFLLNDKSLKSETTYSNAAGETSSVTLNKDVSEFSVIDIFYKNYDGYYNSVRVENPNGKTVQLLTCSPNSNSNGTYFRVAMANISGNTITLSNRMQSWIQNTTAQAAALDTAIKIVKIIGYYDTLAINYTEKKINNVTTGKYIHLTNTSPQIIQPGTEYEVAWQKTYANTAGNLLAKSDNKVVIGTGVTSVYVHSQYRDDTNKKKFMYIIKNGEKVSVTTTNDQMAIISDVIPVSEGDVLSIDTYIQGSDASTIVGGGYEAWEFFKVVILN